MDPVLFGRDESAGALREALASAFEGRGRVAVISGEAGIGKSALAAALAQEAEGKGATVTWGRAWEFADAPPYFPIWPCLRALGIVGAERARESHDEHAFHLWESVAVGLTRATGQAPTVWILEDLHAADLATLDLLTFLAQPIRALRALVVATVRAKDPRIDDRMMQRLTRLSRDGLDVRLGPLTERDVGAFTEATLGRSVGARERKHLVELTGGNPLFVVECVRAFRAAGGVEGTLGSLPPTVRQVVLDRLALHPEATRRALSSGAVLGREFSAAAIARMDETLPARVIDALLPALRSGLVNEARPGQFVFSHTLVRDAIDDALAAEERRFLHFRAAAALAPLGDSADVLVERARHALAALPAGDAEGALAIATTATSLLEREGASDRAFELHARIDVARAAGFLPRASCHEKLHVAQVARDAGRPAASRRLCEEVIAEARVAGDAELFARAALLQAADVRMAVLDRAQVARLEEARAALGERAPELECRVLARLATALQPAPDPAVPAAMTREAVSRAHATGADDAILDVLDVAGWGLYGAPLAERLASSVELLDRALAANDRPKALGAYTWVALQRGETGDFGASDRAITSALALSDELGHPRHRWSALLLAAGRASALGYFVEADGYVSEVAQLEALVDDPSVGFALVMHEVMREKNQRRDDRLRAALARLDAAMGDVEQPSLYGALARAVCFARFEDVETTRAQLAIIGARAESFAPYPPSLAFFGEACARAGTAEERRRARDMLVRTEQVDLMGGHLSFVYEGTTHRVIGLLDAALGDLVGAEQRLRKAHTLAVERRHRPWVAQIAHELAGVALRAGKGAEARAWADESLRIARELGMTGLAETLRDRSALPGAQPAVTMTLDGEIWTVTRDSRKARVKDSRGMRLLARLVERPGEELHVLALASDDATSMGESSAGDVLDDRARKAYRARLVQLADELVEAERRHDAAAGARLVREKRALESELARAVGLGGRARQAGSATERARVNVQRRVKDAVARIADVEESLGRFFEGAVSTGTFCVFRP